MDYKNIMNNSSFNYNEFYEEMIARKEKQHGLSVTDSEKLAQKRELGVKKYGDYSFQSKFSASMTSPVIEHFKEEIYDALNYAFHIEFLIDTNSFDNKEQIYKIIDDLIILLDNFKLFENSF